MFGIMMICALICNGIVLAKVANLIVNKQLCSWIEFTCVNSYCSCKLRVKNKLMNDKVVMVRMTVVKININ